MIVVTLILVAIVLAVIVSGVSLIRDARRTNIPGPTPWPIVGNGLMFLGDTTDFLNALGNLCTKYGRAARVHIMSMRFVILSDAKLIEPLISSSEHITKGMSYNYLHPWLGMGLLTATGSKWRSHRKFMTPAFHFTILQTFLPIFLKNNKRWIKKLESLADGKPFDMFPIAAMITLDNVAEAAMGVEINAAENEGESKYVQAISDVTEIISMRMFNILLSYDWIFKWHPLGRKQRDALKILHGQTNKVIAERMKQLQESKITLENYNSEFGIKNKCPFLDLLLLSEVDGKRLDIDSVREEVDTFMFEGHDTTASAISFILFSLSNNVHIQDKILEELDSIFGDDDRDPTYRDLSQMKYLDLVIKESLRIFPSVPAIGRINFQDIDVDGYHIPKGTNITFNIFHMQRHPKYFEDPMVFRPERFRDENLKHVYSWVPFSAGPRNCIGQKFAMMELKVTISRVVKSFRVLPSGIEPILGTDLILRSKNGVQIRLLPRTQKNISLNKSEKKLTTLSI